MATSSSAFELTDVLIANAQSAVQMICDSISGRISGLLEKTRKQAMNPELLAPFSCCLERYTDTRIEPTLCCLGSLSSTYSVLRDLWLCKFGAVFSN